MMLMTQTPLVASKVAVLSEVPFQLRPRNATGARPSGVFFLPSSPVGPRVRTDAAVLSAVDGTGASHQSDGMNANTITVTTPRAIDSSRAANEALNRSKGRQTAYLHLPGNSGVALARCQMQNNTRCSSARNGDTHSPSTGEAK
jgi:hypothetical protein